MGYQLRMSAEIQDWLENLRTADPPRARLVAEALAALAAGGASVGPPLVRPADPADPGPAEAELDPRAALDQAYQDQLEQLAAMRRRVADAAALARQFSAQIGDLGALRVRLAEQRAEASAADDAGRVEAVQQAMADVDRQAATLRERLPQVDCGRAGAHPAELSAAGTHGGAADQEGNAEGAIHRRGRRVHGDPGQRGAGCRPVRPAGPGTGRGPAGDHRRGHQAKLQAITADIERELRRAGQPASAAVDCRPAGAASRGARAGGGQCGRDQHPVRCRAAGHRAADRRTRWRRGDPGAPRRGSQRGPGGAPADPVQPGRRASRAQLSGCCRGAGRVRVSRTRAASCGSCKAAP